VFRDALVSWTGEHGFVDTVLNSLSGDFIKASLDGLRQSSGGTFIELGKRGIWTAEDVAAKYPHVTYHVVAIDSMIETRPKKFQTLLSRIQTGSRHHPEGLPLTAFDIKTQCVEAFQFLQKAKHMGKVVLSACPSQSAASRQREWQRKAVEETEAAMQRAQLPETAQDGVTHIDLDRFAASAVQDILETLQSDDEKQKAQADLSTRLTDMLQQTNATTVELSDESQSSYPSLIQESVLYLKQVIESGSTADASEVPVQSASLRGAFEAAWQSSKETCPRAELVSCIRSIARCFPSGGLLKVLHYSNGLSCVRDTVDAVEGRRSHLVFGGDQAASSQTLSHCPEDVQVDFVSVKLDELDTCFAQGQFNLAVICGLYGKADDLADALKNVRSLLAPTGVLLVVTCCGDGPLHGLLRETLSDTFWLPTWMELKQVLGHGGFTTHQSSSRGRGRPFEIVPASAVEGPGTILPAPPSTSFHPDGTYLITGRSGVLALMIARLLVENGARHILVPSRLEGGRLPGNSDLPGETVPAEAVPMYQSAAWEWLRDSVAEVTPVPGDVNDITYLITLLRMIKARLPPLKGVVHAGGAAESVSIREHTRQHFQRAVTEDVGALWNLHQSTLDEDQLDVFIACNSHAAAFGVPLNVSAGAACSLIESLIVYRQSKGLPAQSIDFGVLSDGDELAEMTGGEAGRIAVLAKQGFLRIDRDLAEGALSAVLMQHRLTAMCVSPIRWEALQRSFMRRIGGSYYDVLSLCSKPRIVPLKREGVHTVGKAGRPHATDEGTQTSMSEIASPEERKEWVTKVLIETVQHMTASTNVALAMNTSLVDLGLDSLSAVELRNTLSRRLGVKLPATTLFDYPTLGAMIDFLVAETASEGEKTPWTIGAHISQRAAVGPRDRRAAVTGMACRLPGGSDSPQALWKMMMSGKDCVTEVPPDRWDHDEFYRADENASGWTTYSRHGAFIDGVEMFDHTAFNITPFEAAAVDPQQRVLLEVVLEALHDSSMTMESVRGTRTGVYSGCCGNDWNYINISKRRDMTAFHGTGSAASIISNRISFAFALRGPSMTIDTACSSALVASDAAVNALRDGTVDVAVLGGVQLLLSPQNYVIFAKARMLSRGGRCKTFSAQADGFGRGEGCVAFILKPANSSSGPAERIHGFVCGTAVNSDGRTATLPAPNGPAQRDCIAAALVDAALKPNDIDYIESHGTGTALGDPLEVGAVRSVFSKGRRRPHPLVIGALKTNIGHLEGASGVAGLIKLVLALQRGVVPPSLHLSGLNPHIEVDDFPVVLPVDAVRLPRVAAGAKGGRLCAGVSSFGFGGTNAHVIFSCEHKQDTSESSRAARGARVDEATAVSGPWVPNRRAFHWQETVHPFLGPDIESAQQRRGLRGRYRRFIGSDFLSLFKDHVVKAEVVFPAAAWIELCIAGARKAFNKPRDTPIITNVSFQLPLVFSRDAGKVLRLAVGDGPNPKVQAATVPEDAEQEADSEGQIIHVTANVYDFTSSDDDDSDDAPDGGRGTSTLADLQARIKQPLAVDTVYSKMRTGGLEYGPEYRTVRKLWVDSSSSECLGEVRLDHHIGPLDAACNMHPALLDGAFQSAGCLVRSHQHTLLVPAGVELVCLEPCKADETLFSHAVLKESKASGVVVDIDIYAAATGRVVGRIERLQLRPFQPKAAERPSYADLLWSVEWEEVDYDKPVGDSALEAPESPTLSVEESESSPRSASSPASSLPSCLHLRLPSPARLVTANTPGRTVSRDQLVSLTVKDIEKMLRSEEWALVTYWVGDDYASAEDALDELLTLCKALRNVVLHRDGTSRKPPAFTFLVVTRDIFHIHSSEEDAPPLFEVCRAHMAGIWGFLRSARLEMPAGITLASLDIEHDSEDADSSSGGLPNLLGIVQAGAGKVQEVEMAYATRAEKLYAPRLKDSSIAVKGPMELHMAERGAMSNLSLRQLDEAERIAPGPGQVELRVRAVGLNFRDVLNVMGLYPGDPGPPGSDCSGIVTRLGPEINHLKLGDDVYGIAAGCLRTYVTTSVHTMAVKPTKFTFEQAAAMPSVFGTVEVAFTDLGKVQASNRVLIHAASGGVGLAAIQYCRRVGASVYATAGSAEKQQYLRSLGVEYVTSTRDVSRFKTDMRAFLGVPQEGGGALPTDGDAGLDVVLNCLSGEFIDESVSLMKHVGGRFLEIGKRGIWTREQMAAVRPQAAYHPIALDEMIEADPAWFGQRLADLTKLADTGVLQPLPICQFDVDAAPSAEDLDTSSDRTMGDAIAAFRFMQKAKHIGKVVISWSSAVDCATRSPSSTAGPANPADVHVITGGVGGLGLVVARWLVSEGVKSIVLVSRRGAPPAQTDTKTGEPNPLYRHWQWLTQSAANVTIKKADVSNMEHVDELLSGIVPETDFDLGLDNSPSSGACLGGLWHAAGVLADAPLAEQTRSSITRVFGPKVWGAWNLHARLARTSVKNFVLFSSITGVLGNRGQTNYSAANACLDALAQWRRKHGLPALSVQWGGWKEQGMAAQQANLTQLTRMGIYSISNDLGLRVLDSLIRPSNPLPVVAVQPLALRRFIRQFVTPPALFARLAAGTDTRSRGEGGLDKELAGMSVEKRRERVREVVVETAKMTMGMAEDKLDFDLPLQELGVDSLGAVEFRNELSRRLDMRLSATLLFDAPTLGAVVDHIVTETMMEAGSRQDGGAALVGVDAKAGGGVSGGSQNIAIVGMACHFPGECYSPQALWDFLLSHGNAIDDMPNMRWDKERLCAVTDPDDPRCLCYTTKGAFIDDVDMFDASLFNISPVEATSMDPQQRLILEVAYGAFADAGMTKEALSGSSTGVFIGACTHDWSILNNLAIYAIVYGNQVSDVSAFMGTSSASSIISNRLSYAMGLKGPSLCVDTACSSSLVACDMAVRSLRQGGCDTALVGGVHLMIAPGNYVAFSKARMLSPEGTCRTFDEKANGYGRAEGSGAVVLRRAGGGRSGPNGVWATIRGIAVNQDGKSASLTAPNGPSQREVIAQALKDAGVRAADVSYIETHGTATSLGDPIEIGALRSVFEAGRRRENPLVLGALKSNMGHMEGSAGIAGFIKLVLVLVQQTAPANLHLSGLNPHIEVDDFPVVLPVDAVRLPRVAAGAKGGRLCAGVSSFGFGGTNAHVVLSREHKHDTRSLTVQREDPTEPPPMASDEDIQPPADGPSGAAASRTVFLFTGQGSQRLKMCEQLYESEPAFKVALDSCHEILERQCGMSLLQFLYESPPSDPPASDTRYLQPSLFAVEYALSELLKSKGVTPDAVIGHSLGEYVAAVVAGVMSLEDGIFLVAERARLMAELPEQDGVMVALRKSAEEMEPTLHEIISEEGDDMMAIGAINGPQSVVISGRHDLVQKALDKMKAGSYRFLTVSHAFHSPMMKEVATQFRKTCEAVTFSLPRDEVRFISTVTGQEITDGLLSPEYWADHILKPVRFSDAMVSALQDDYEVFLEVGPAPVLTSLAQRIDAKKDNSSGGQPTMVAALRSPTDERQSLAKAIETVTGCREKALMAQQGDRQGRGRRQSLPWPELRHPLLAKRLMASDTTSDNKMVYLTAMPREGLALYKDHCVAGQSTMPAAGFIEVAVSAIRELQAEEWLHRTGHDGSVVLEDVEFERPMTVEAAWDQHYDFRTALRLECSVTKDGTVTLGSREVSEDRGLAPSVRHVRAELAKDTAPSVDPLAAEDQLQKAKAGCNKKLSVPQLYEILDRVGLNYGETFRTVSAVWQGDNEALGLISPPSKKSITRFLSMDPRVVDGALHCVCAAVSSSEATANVRAVVPVAIGRVQIRPIPHDSSIWSHVMIHPSKSTRTKIMADIRLFSAEGKLLAAFDEFRFMEANLSGLTPQVDLSTAMWNTEWMQVAAQRKATQECVGRWLLVGGQSADDILNQVGGVEAAASSLTVRASTVEGVDKALDSESFTDVFFTESSDAAQDAVDVLEALTQVIRSMVRVSSASGSTTAPTLWVLSRGTQQVLSIDERLPCDPVHAGVWGMARAARLEVGDAVDIRSLELDSDGVAGVSGVPLLQSLSKTVTTFKAPDVDSLVENEIAIRGHPYVRRLVRGRHVAEGSVELHMADRGALSNLMVRPLSHAQRLSPGPGQVELRVCAVGLNFRDVLNVMGLYPGDPGPPGSDCSGIVTRLGPDVTGATQHHPHFRVGDE
ncbi:unnamed protein product, partial [Vitrella brassicaformis CCMP3155]